MKKSNVMSPPPATRSSNNNFDTIPSVSNEKWEQIFGKLNQINVAQARLVCPYWRTIIDNNYKFSIIIGERWFEQLPVPFKTKTCTIYRLKKHADRIFKYPYNVENIKVNTNVRLSTLRNTFEETKKLLNLYFAYSSEDEEQIGMPEGPVHFKYLLQLNVFHNNEKCIISKGNARFTNTQRLFSYEMPALQTLDVRIIELWDTIDKILPSFFKFLAKHSKTIKQLRTNFITDLLFDNKASIPLSEELFKEMQPQNIRNQLHDSDFQVTTLIVTLPTRYFRLWERFMNNQNKLITVYIEYIELDFLDRFYAIPFKTIQPTLVRNASTLVNLHLTYITLEKNQNPNVDLPQFLPIDGLVFQYFHKLRRLILRRSTINDWNNLAIHLNETTLINISSIPSKLLKVLEIKRLVCETSELERLVENATRLKIVIFHFTGDVDGKGVTTQIIDCLAKKSDIHIVDVLPLNLPPDKTEAKKMLVELEKEYPQAIQYPHERHPHYYFNFDRFRKGLVQETYALYTHPFFF